MKILNLLLWVTQLGFSILFPLCFFLYLGYWLQNKFSLGLWVILLFGILGLLTSVSTVKSCLRSLLKAADEASPQRDTPIAFNNHD